MKKVLLLLLLSASVNLVFAQEVYTSSGRADHGKKKKKTEGYDPSKLIVGGSVMLGFGTGYADFGLSPMVGYRFTDHFSAGVGIGYEFTKLPITLTDPNTGAYVDYSTKYNTISPNIWARYFVYRNIFVSGVFENDFVLYNGYDYSQQTGDIIKVKENVTVPCLLLGPGLKQPIGGRTSVIVELLYDVLQQPYSPYLNQPVFRVSFCAGL